MARITLHGAHDPATVIAFLSVTVSTCRIQLEATTIHLDDGEKGLLTPQAFPKVATIWETIVLQ